ncbi:MAG: hypothetical protein PUG80_03775, partial [Eubacteriales bacterium]|nr:hypothetical protein [Eubacteriales bacterium]
MKKRIFATMLALIMLISIMPTSAMAAYLPRLNGYGARPSAGMDEGGGASDMPTMVKTAEWDDVENGI